MTKALTDAQRVFDEAAAKLAKNKNDPDGKTDVTQEMLDSQAADLAKAQKSLDMGKETLAAWPSQPEFLCLPLEPPTPTKSAVYPPERLLEICLAVEERLRKKQRIYIFSSDGRGRAGTVAACLFARLYGMTGHDALSRVQRTFDSRGDMLLRNKKRRKGKQLPRLSCPTHQVQRVSVLRFIDGMEREMFRGVSRTGPKRDPDTGAELRGKGYDILYTQDAVRNVGVPHMAAPERVFFKGRMNHWWEHRERLHDTDFQAQADILNKTRDPDLPYAEDAAAFKNVWTPRTRLQMFGHRSELAKVAASKWKKGTKTVLGAIRMDRISKKAAMQRVRDAQKKALAEARLARKKNARKLRKLKNRPPKKKKDPKKKKKMAEGEGKAVVETNA